jgi:hypothetical protein
VSVYVVMKDGSRVEWVDRDGRDSYDETGEDRDSHAFLWKRRYSHYVTKLGDLVIVETTLETEADIQGHWVERVAEIARFRHVRWVEVTTG